jgi:hypothetical protein
MVVSVPTYVRKYAAQSQVARYLKMALVSILGSNSFDCFDWRYVDADSWRKAMVRNIRERVDAPA